MTSLLSVVVPVLNEAENVEALWARLSAAGKTLDRDVEFIFVDDGSTDESFALLSALAETEPQVRCVSLSRNFGSHGACLAGFERAKGDHVVILTADLQDPPELLPKFLEAADEGYDVVWGQRTRRDDPKITLFFSLAYNRLMQKIALPNWPEQGFDFVLVSRAIVDFVVTRRERNTSLFGQILWAGYKQKCVPYTREARKRGKSKWTLGKKIKLAVDSFASFSYVPIRLISMLGFVCAIAGSGYGLFIFSQRLLGGIVVGGFAALMMVTLVLGGCQLVMLGVIGEYLWRTFDDVRGRPPFIVAGEVGFDRKKDSEAVT